MLSSFIQFLKIIISGNTPKGIQFRTFLAIILTFSVLIIEIIMFYTNWTNIPKMIPYDYDWDGHPKNLCEKEWIWYNILFQIFIIFLVFIIKHFSYKIKYVHQIVFDKKNQIIPIINKRFSMLSWETAMLFVTTEQSYIFTLTKIIGTPTCDDIVTLVFLFWQVLLIFEFRSDLKKLISST